MSLKEYLLTDTSPAAASTVASTVAIATGLEQFELFTVDASLQGATGGALDVYLQRFSQQLNEWRDWFHFTQLASAAALVRYSFDTKIAPSTGVLSPGFGTTPSLTTGTLASQHPGGKLRLLFVAGAGTSAGAIQKVSIIGWRRR